MLMKMFYVGEKPVNDHNAGNKARLDISELLRRRYGESKVSFVDYKLDSLIARIIHLLNIKRHFLIRYNIAQIKKQKDALMCVQYPYYTKTKIYTILEEAVKKNISIAIIHDIESLRLRNGYGIEKEIERLNNSAIVVTHNVLMTNLLRYYGLKTKVVELRVFDYLLSKQPKQKNYDLGRPIVFAGSLGKSGFLLDPRLSTIDVQFNLYGPNMPDSLIHYDNVSYCGSFSPDELPFNLNGSFGLVWDGDCIDTCSGSLGEYLKINNPHKLSLYIAAGIPIIVWEQAAVASLVEKYNIGVTVKSIEDIPRRIKGIRVEDYKNYLKNIRVLQNKVINGFFTNNALIQCEELLYEK